MKKGLLFICLFILSWSIFAQNIVVESFVHVETDLTANLEGTTVLDQNGEKCALIKVRSNPPTKDFIFDVGQLGIQEVRYDGPDIWLYVPYGVRRITIKHSQLGVLDDYDLGISVKKASTYILTLRVGSIQTVIEDEIRQQYLMFTVDPKDALVEVDNEVWEVTDGSCAKLLNFGTYEYRIRSQYYHDEVGKVTLNNANDTKVISVNLRPAHGWIEVNGVGDLAGATVYVDDEKVGLAPVKTRKLSSGSYRVRIVKDLFHEYSENVVVEDNQTTVLSPTLMGNYSTVTITTKSGAEIWIDGERKGVSTWSGRLPFGVHMMEAKMASHRSQSKTINIAESETTKAILLPDPQPMYGSLSVEVLPDFADVYINGEKVGTTPQMIREMLVGEYKVEVRKEGKTSHEEQVVVREGELSSVRGELQDADLVFNVNGVEFKMIRVEGGEFMMGDNSKKASFDEKAHLVSLDSYYIGETEVTNALWKAVMGKGTIYSHYSDERLNQYPACASWYDCQEFIEKLNMLTGKQFRMPTEAEWEFAARGGNRSQGYKYSGSNKLEDVAWYSDNQNGKAYYPVAQKKPNELGIYDMSGNEREWCNDYFDFSYYDNSPKHNPQGTTSSSLGRVVRGGECSSSKDDCRVTHRDYEKPGDVYGNSALRLSLSLLGEGNVSQDERVAVNKGGLEDGREDLNKLKFKVRGIQFNMIQVEGGEFMMGREVSEDYGSDDECPAHLVSLDSYYIGETEVTQELWEAVMGRNPVEDREGGNYPVVNVTWSECQKFIEKLNELTGKKFRLPTEAEWEYAARGGNRSQGYKYSGSNNPDDVAWYESYKNYPVAQKQPNELGIYDMSGNVAEWCRDWYGSDYYKNSPKHDPWGPTGSSRGRVVRGGDKYDCRVVNRESHTEYKGFHRLGLRLVLE